MIAAVRNLPKAERLRVLTAASASLLGRDVDERVRPVPERVRAVLQEVDRRVRVEPDTPPDEVVELQVAFIQDELVHAALEGTNRRAVEDRLKGRGLLHPSEFRVEPLRADDNFAKEGISLELLREVVRKPDAYEYLFSDEQPDGRMARALLAYARRDVRGEGRTLLYLARVEGGSLRVDEALQVFHDDVALEERAVPEDVLKAFLAVYGYPFSFGEDLSEEHVYVREALIQDQKWSPTWGLHFKKDSDYVRLISVVRFINNAVEYRATFGINETKYRHALRRHGIFIHE